MRDTSVMEIVPTVELEAVPDQPNHRAHLDVYLETGEQLHADTEIVIGHPDNPMSWDDLHVKFQGLVEPVLGTGKAEELYAALRRFGAQGTMADITKLLQP